MVHVVSKQPLTAESRVQARGSPCEVCTGQTSAGTYFLSSIFVFHFNIIPPNFRPHLRQKFYYYPEEKPTNLGTLNQRSSVLCSRSARREGLTRYQLLETHVGTV